MEIAVFNHRLSRSRGGAEGWTTQFIQWLSAHNHSVHLVSSHEPTAEVAPYIRRVTIFPSRDRFEFSRAVSTRFNRDYVDIVHDMGFGYRSDVFHPHSGSQRALDEARSKTCEGVEKLGFELMRRLGRRQRRLTALADRQFQQPETRFLAVSQKVARDMVRLHQVPAERIEVIYNGVDTTRFSPANCIRFRDKVREQLRAAKRDFVLLCVAHNHRLKGVPNLLRVLKSISDPPIHLVVVGGRRQRPRQFFINSHRVSFLGACDHSLPYYAAADAFVLPTHYDACSLTVLEAMACGLPVITTCANGASELIEDQIDGLLLRSSTDLSALRESIKTCQCEATRLIIGQNARLKAIQHSLDVNFSAVEVLYKRILVGTRSADCLHGKAA